MSYNITFLDNVTSIGDLTNGVVSLGNGEVFAMLLTVIYIGQVAVFKNYDTIVSFIISGFNTSLIAGVMWWLGWIGWHIAIIPLILFVIAVVVHWFR